MAGRLYVALTGDLVGSRELSGSRLGRVRREVIAAVDRLGRLDRSIVRGRPEFFRGDAWQALIGRPEHGLRAALYLRSALIARDLGDTRIGIGIGPVRKIHPKRVSLSTGPAFTCSGEALDEMPAKFRMNARLAEADAAVAGWIGAVVRLCDVVAGGWTARQAQIVGLALLHPGATHQDLADRLRPRASRQLVTKTLAANGWDGLAAALEQFEKFDWTSLST